MKMTDSSLVSVTGKVIETLPASMFRVQLEDSENIILAYLSGKMKMNKIKVIVGDTVTVETSIYDVTRGRIVYRS